MQKKKTTVNRMIRFQKIIKRIIILLFVFVCILFYMDWLVEKGGTWSPDYPEVDLGGILNGKELTEEDYHTIFLQTGLGKEAVDDLLHKKSGENRLRVFEKMQDDFFTSGVYVSRKIGFITSEERIRNQDGFTVRGFEIPSIKNGDVLITKATHSIGWRHGHAAIITDASKGETLEAIVLGQNSIFQKTSKWQTYPSFILLRLKDDKNGDAEKIAQYAKENIYDIPYGLFSGIPSKEPKLIEKTQCSHLVWYPYKLFGYDIDSDGSWLVTPKDIANSDYFQVVQVYGVNPEDIWP